MEQLWEVLVCLQCASLMHPTYAQLDLSPVRKLATHMLDTLFFQHVVHQPNSVETCIIVHKKKRIIYCTTIAHDRRLENIVSIPYSVKSTTNTDSCSHHQPTTAIWGCFLYKNWVFFRIPCSLQMNTRRLSDSTLNHDSSEKELISIRHASIHDDLPPSFCDLYDVVELTWCTPWA